MIKKKKGRGIKNHLLTLAEKRQRILQQQQEEQRRIENRQHQKDIKLFKYFLTHKLKIPVGQLDQLEYWIGNIKLVPVFGFKENNFIIWLLKGEEIERRVVDYVSAYIAGYNYDEPIQLCESWHLGELIKKLEEEGVDTLL